MVDRIVTVPDSLELPAAVKVPSARLSNSTATGRAVLAATDAAAARTVLGITELSGTGMPNGVVTASPGAYYTDTAGTNGAWRWLKKSGTGNTGWDVVHGDTGWRRVNADADWLAALQPTGVNVASNLTRVRRSNDIVHLSVGMDKNAVGGLTATGPIPQGWRTSAPVAVLLSSSSLGLVRLWLNAGGGLPAIQGSGPIIGASGLASYATTDPWPSTLPGTPV